MAELPDRAYDAVRNRDTEKYDCFCEMVENDLSVDWMQMIFQYYHADRIGARLNNGQSF